MLRDVLGGEEPSAEAFLREVAPALVGAMDDGRGHAGACGGGAARAARRLAQPGLQRAELETGVGALN